MAERFENWLAGNDNTFGDQLRAFIESAWKAIVELLNALGEWPIDFE